MKSFSIFVYKDNLIHVHKPKSIADKVDSMKDDNNEIMEMEDNELDPRISNPNDPADDYDTPDEYDLHKINISLNDKICKDSVQKINDKSKFDELRFLRNDNKDI